MSWKHGYTINEVESWIKIAKERKHTHIKIILGIEPHTGKKVMYGWKWVSIEP